MPVTIRNLGFFCGSMPRSAATLAWKKPVQVPGCLPKTTRREIAGEEIEEVDGLDLGIDRAGGHGERVGAVGGHGVQGGVGPEPAQDQAAHQADRHGDEPTELLPANHDGLLSKSLGPS